jgi:hypothetical protein
MERRQRGQGEEVNEVLKKNEEDFMMALRTQNCYIYIRIPQEQKMDFKWSSICVS